MIGYPLDELYQEVAYISYYFHWQPDTVLTLEHRARRRWVEEIANINRKLNAGA